MGLILSKTLVLRVRRACSTEWSIRLTNWKSGIGLLLSQYSLIIDLIIRSRILGEVEAIRKDRIFAFLWNERDLSVLSARGEMDVQQTIFSEHFFRMMAGILSSPVDFLLLFEVCNHIRFDKLVW